MTSSNAADSVCWAMTFANRPAGTTALAKTYMVNCFLDPRDPVNEAAAAIMTSAPDGLDNHRGGTGG